MGLDIHLIKFKKNMAEVIYKEEEYSTKSEELWEEITGGKKYHDCTEQEKNKASKATDKLAEEMGLNKWGNDEEAREDIRLQSQKHPKHSIYKIGYFRSSYNDSGINNILQNAIGKDLYYIFEPTKKYELKYEFVPDWKNSLLRAKEVLILYTEHIAKLGYIRIATYGYNELLGSPNDYPIDSEQKAMEVFMEEFEKYKKRENKDPDFVSYSNREGNFMFDDPLEVLAIISGVKRRFFVEEKLPVQYVVYKVDKSDGVDFYIEALDIVIETCEWVLERLKENKDAIYALSWSS